jgi:hypothetical protein
MGRAMELNNIKLPASLIVELYRNSLVDSTDQAAKFQPDFAAQEKLIPDKPWNFLGENLRNVLILVDINNTPHLPEVELNFLTAMLTACKLSVEDVAIVNVHSFPNVSYKELLGYFKTNRVFLFGVEPASLEMPLNFPHFQVQEFSGASFLYVPVIKELEADKVLKSKLWVCLRRIFSI